jgi:hypothetical protein
MVTNGREFALAFSIRLLEKKLLVGVRWFSLKWREGAFR